jgi:hypothetical protein
MTEYLDHDNKKLEKGFYTTIFVPGLPGEGGQQGGDISYFTGKYNKRNEPIIICSTDYGRNNEKYNLNERPCSQGEFSHLERISVDDVNQKIDDLKLKLNWFEETLKK